MADHQEQWPIAWMCEALEVSASGYYAWASRTPSPTETRQQKLIAAIRVIHAESKDATAARA
jgi:putative transposase